MTPTPPISGPAARLLSDLIDDLDSGARVTLWLAAVAPRDFVHDSPIVRVVGGRDRRHRVNACAVDALRLAGAFDVAERSSPRDDSDPQWLKLTVTDVGRALAKSAPPPVSAIERALALVATGDIETGGYSALDGRKRIDVRTLATLSAQGLMWEDGTEWLMHLTDAGRRELAKSPEVAATEHLAFAARLIHRPTESRYHRGRSSVKGWGGRTSGARIDCSCGWFVRANGGVADARSMHRSHVEDRIDQNVAAAGLV